MVQFSAFAFKLISTNRFVSADLHMHILTNDYTRSQSSWHSFNIICFSAVPPHAPDWLESSSPNYRAMTPLQTGLLATSSQLNGSCAPPPSACDSENGKGFTFIDVTSSRNVATNDDCRSSKCLVPS